MKMKLQANVLSTEFKEHKSKEKKKLQPQASGV